MKRKIEKGDVGVIIGRFQVPELHEAHKELIDSVCKEHDRVIIFLGLSPVRVTRNNPLDFEGRKQMILDDYPDVTVLYVKDQKSDEAWSRKIDSSISDLIGPDQNATLYGSRSSFIKHYTGKFQTQELEQTRFISGTEIRKVISRKVKGHKYFRSGVIWAAYNQYPVSYTTVDIAILDGNKVLLGKKPYEDKYRFVGGFSDPSSENFEEDAKREVSEETGLAVGDLKYLASFKIDDWRYRGEVDSIKTLFFTAIYIYGRPEANDDISEVRWFKLDDKILDHIVDGHLPLMNHLLTFIKGKQK